MHTQSIAALGRSLRAREFSAVELTTALLDRIRSLDPVINSFITLTPELALEAARRADAELRRGEERGPLHGIPLGLKDLFDVADVRCTFGSRILHDRVPTENAAVVDRLRAAGAVLLGKHNLHEFAFGVTNENPHYGVVHNPWDTARIAGGSSGGTAAAIAAGLCPGGLGSDTGGSVRIPAALCGVVGFKPTYDRVSRAGVLPLSPSMDHVGPLARSALDCALLFEAIADSPPSSDLLTQLEAGVGGLRLGVPRELMSDPTVVTDDVASLVRQALGALESEGAKISEVSVPSLTEAVPAGLTLMAAEAAAWHAGWLADRADEYGADVLARLRGGASSLATEYVQALQVRRRLQHDLAAAFDEVDVIVGPTVGLVALEIGRTLEPRGDGVVPRSLLNRLTLPANLAGVPAVSVPCGNVAGLPVGLQIVGPLDGDGLVLRVAHAFERTGVYTSALANPPAN